MDKKQQGKVGIVAVGLGKSYDRGIVLGKVSFSLKMDETLVITGPSGCGKTTLLRLLAGLEVPDAGEIYIENKRISAKGWATEPHTRGIGFVFQNPALWPHMTVEKNILFGLHSMGKKEANKRVLNLLQGVSMAHMAQRYPDQLSGGEAKRVAIVRSLAPRPKFVLMDEPLTHLHVGLKEQLLSLILQEIQENQASLLYVTHDEGEARFIGGKRLNLQSMYCEEEYES